MIAELRYAHGALWHSDAWYRRAWWIAPQLLALVGAVAIMTGGSASSGAGEGSGWAQPATNPPAVQDAYTETLALRDRAETDPAEFAKLLRQANSGDANSQFAVATLYDGRLNLTRLVAPNPVTAMMWYHTASMQGHIDAANNYGSALVFGTPGVPRSVTEGLTYLLRAGNANNTLAQHSLGVLYRDGAPGVKPSPANSLQWFQRAAGNGDHYAQAEIGAAYWDGKAPYNRDAVEAVKWYTQAAQDPSQVNAARMLGIAYRDGIGAAPNTASALAWFQRAADHNDAYALGQVKLLSGR